MYLLFVQLVMQLLICSIIFSHKQMMLTSLGFRSEIHKELCCERETSPGNVLQPLIPLRLHYTT
jgi:hypothetical protein